MTFQELVQKHWPQARAHWSDHLLLSQPVAHGCEQGVACIDLNTRQVCLNFELIQQKGLEDCFEALLAHEIGHHVRFPGSLAVSARLRLLEKTLLPIPGYSLINLFTDLMINERLGELYRDQFARVYEAFAPDLAWQNDPAFLFYLTIYEELWQLRPGQLLGPAAAEYEELYPDSRGEAALLAESLFRLGPNLYTQFLYFVSVLSRYVKPREGDHPQSVDPYQCGHGEPGPEDWAEALTPDSKEREALRRAIREGWLRDQPQLEEHVLERRIAGLPGFGTQDATLIPEVMAAYYRQQAERFLLRPPPCWTLGEDLVPTSLTEWESGDAVRDIDWLSSLLQKGAQLAGVEPLKRIKVAEYEGYDSGFWQPRVEIYLDVSGSMPDPRYTRNAMTLAAQILALGSIRAGGWARALVYSDGFVAYWQWCRSEVELSRFLMHFIGCGTEFPFDKLQESVEECVSYRPVRVVITDRDFDANYQKCGRAPQILAGAAARSQPFILLQHLADPEAMSVYRSAGCEVMSVQEMEDFPRLAAGLARVLFDNKKATADV